MENKTLVQDMSFRQRSFTSRGKMNNIRVFASLHGWSNYILPFLLIFTISSYVFFLTFVIIEYAISFSYPYIALYFIILALF